MEGRLIEKGPAPRVISRRAVGLFGFKRFGNYCSGLKRDGSDCRLRQRRGKRDKFFLDALLPCQLTLFLAILNGGCPARIPAVITDQATEGKHRVNMGDLPRHTRLFHTTLHDNFVTALD